MGSLRLLEPRGYVVLKLAVQVPTPVFTALQVWCDSGARRIFNPQGRRSQRLVKSNRSKLVRKFLAECEQLLRRRFPHALPTDWVVIRSKAGCLQQPAHTDYLPDQI